MPEMATIDDYLRDYASQLRSSDQAPTSKADWDKRRQTLRERMFAAIGPFPEKPCALEAKVLGVLERDGYRIEKLIYQTRPNMWVTANAYVPTLKPKQQVPAVLVVHGHWRGARRDPVVQARCLGLVKLGFFVLAVDAFGAGERYTKPAEGTYHGSLYGSTLWPVGQSLLGVQVYDNMRAIDYLQTRIEVNGKFGITGASGGGNQTMYAGALDERFAAVVPVCSVGNYQVYLKTACCVCEVLPKALTFTEEGDVLGLVAPRGLMVTSATKDGIQFSPNEALKSLERAKAIFALHNAETHVKHVIVESGHDYNKPMREAMYGWMTWHLKGEGKGEPIIEPAHTVEKFPDLACFPNPADRPKGFLTPPLFAASEAARRIQTLNKTAPTHPEMWDASSRTTRTDLRTLLAIDIKDLIANQQVKGEVVRKDGIPRWTHTIRGAGGVPMMAEWLGDGKKGTALVLHLAGHNEARVHPIVKALLGRGYRVGLPDLRGIGATKPKGDAIAGAPDHNSAEHAIWVGKPLLGQWVTDCGTWASTIERQKDEKHLVVGIGPAGVVALASAALFPDQIDGVVTINTFVSYLTDMPYVAGTPMGLLVPNILSVADVPHLAALVAPKRLIITNAENAQGRKLSDKEMAEAFTFTTGVYKTLGRAELLTLTTTPDWNNL